MKRLFKKIISDVLFPLIALTLAVIILTWLVVSDASAGGEYLPEDDKLGIVGNNYTCYNDPRIAYYYPTPSCYGKIPYVDHNKVIICYGCTEWDIVQLREQGHYVFIPRSLWIVNLVWV